MTTGLRVAFLAAMWVAGGCTRSTIVHTGDLSADVPADLSLTFPDDGGGTAPGCGPDLGCAEGLLCMNGMCVPNVRPACTSSDECQDDTWCRCQSGGSDAGPCVGGECVPYGDDGVLTDPDCVNIPAFNVQAFKPPVVSCSWTDEGVYSLPLVIDLDRDGRPEIVVVTAGGTMVALNGKDCTAKWKVKTSLHSYNSLAAADLDGDHLPELVGVDMNGAAVLFDNTGNVLSTSPFVDAPSAGGRGHPVIANVDAAGPAEIIVGGTVMRWMKGVGFTRVFQGAAQDTYWGISPAVVDLDGDGWMELVTGSQVYSIKSQKEITPNDYAAALMMNGRGAYPAIADFNHDGKPDIALSQLGMGNEVFYIWDWAAKKFIYGPVMAASSWNGAPAVADFDGDKVPDIAVTGSSTFRVLSLKCWTNPMAKGCEAKGILWSKAVRDTSGASGPSAFDLNNDGKVDIVYRDECFLRVLDGPTGKTLFVAPITSGTVYEYPVVADVNVDGHADVVVPSTMLGCNGEVDKDTGVAWAGPPSQGVMVYRDPMNRWQPSRPLWNEHAYHITNIGDDLRIPIKEAPNWKSWNNYRQNVQASQAETPGVDYTGRASTTIDNGGMSCDLSERMWASVCNRGNAIAPAGVPGTFYLGDPRGGGTPICSTTTQNPINPGECTDVSCDWQNPPKGPQDVWFRADDDGSGKGTSVFSECRPANDLLHLPGTICNVPG